MAVRGTHGLVLCTALVSGSEVTLKVPISGHTYTFTGTLSGE